MVYSNGSLKCDCFERVGIKITSQRDFENLKCFFRRQVDLHIFTDVPVRRPFHAMCYADKWYKCNICGCLWEFIYPDFPAAGAVRKFQSEKDYIDQMEELEQSLIAKGKLRR